MVNSLVCPECHAPEFTGKSCPTCVTMRSIQFGKSWFQEAVDLSLRALRPPTEKAGERGTPARPEVQANAAHSRGRLGGLGAESPRAGEPVTYRADEQMAESMPPRQPSESVDLAPAASKPRVGEP